MKTKISKLNLITSLMLFLTSCAFAQFNPSNVGAVYPTTRSVARTPNVVLGYVSGGNLAALNSIGVSDGAYSAGTTNTSDTNSYVRSYGNLVSLGGFCEQFYVDSVATYKMQFYSNNIVVKLANSTDSVYLPSTVSLNAAYGKKFGGARFTIKNLTAAAITIVGSTKAEYVDTALVYSLPARTSVSFMYSGLSAPTGTVVATNKLNATWLKK